MLSVCLLIAKTNVRQERPERGRSEFQQEQEHESGMRGMRALLIEGYLMMSGEVGHKLEVKTGLYLVDRGE